MHITMLIPNNDVHQSIKCKINVQKTKTFESILTYIRPFLHAPVSLTPFIIAILLRNWPFIQIARIAFRVIWKQTLHVSVLNGIVSTLAMRRQAQRPFTTYPPGTFFSATFFHCFGLRQTSILAQYTVHILSCILQSYHTLCSSKL